MKALTPATVAAAAGLSAFSALPSVHPVLNHVCCPYIASPSSPRVWPSLGLRLGIAGSPQQSAESGSLSYGLLLRFQLLSTSPRDDAVTFSFIATTYNRADFHHADKASSRTHDARLCGLDVIFKALGHWVDVENWLFACPPSSSAGTWPSPSSGSWFCGTSASRCAAALLRGA